MSEPVKTCLVCKETKCISAFSTDRTRKDGKHPWCKSCVKEYAKTYYSKNNEVLRAKSTQYRLDNLEAVKDYDRERGRSPKGRLRGCDTWRGKAVNLIASMRTCSKQRGHYWDASWWSVEKVLEKIENKSCPVTGLPFALRTISKALYKTNPCSPSPDRIDNTKGYEPNNVMFVSWFYNNMKRDHSQDDVDTMLDILTYHRIEQLLEKEQT